MLYDSLIQQSAKKRWQPNLNILSRKKIITFKLWKQKKIVRNDVVDTFTSVFSVISSSRVSKIYVHDLVERLNGANEGLRERRSILSALFA